MKYPPGIPVLPSKLLIAVESPPFAPGPWAVDTGLTPGVSTRSCVKLRPCSGMSLMTFSSITLPSSEVEPCSSSDCAVTSTLSSTVPTFRLTLRATVSFTPTTNAATLAVAKPVSSIVRA